MNQLVERKFGNRKDAALPGDRAEDRTRNGTHHFGSDFASEARAEEIEEIWERRNSHLMKKASNRHPQELVEGKRGSKVNAFYHAIRRSSLTISKGATNAMKTKISGYQLLGINETTDKKSAREVRDDGSVAALWQ